MTAEIPLPVQIFGTFDVGNYGDLLFPHIARHRLAPLGFAVEPVSPAAAPMGWKDVMPAKPIREAAELPAKPAGILIGGGNIIHTGKAGIPDYNAFGERHAYASLWLGATLAGCIHSVPVMWNAPGVPHPVPERLLSHWVMRHALEAADYVSVRDNASASHFGIRWQDEYMTVPDTAFEISAVWPKASLAPVFSHLLERKGISSDQKFAVFHVKGRSMDEPLENTAQLLESFARAHGLMPILVALAPCHHDDTTTRQLGRLMRQPVVVLDDPKGLREIAAALAHAVLHVGSSLHGLITALSYGVPAVVVRRPNLPKFSGFLSACGRSQDGAPTWREAVAIAASRLGSACMDELKAAEIRSQLDIHWNRIAAILTAGKPNVARQGRFVRSYLQYGLRTSGWPWLLDPAAIPAS